MISFEVLYNQDLQILLLLSVLPQLLSDLATHEVQLFLDLSCPFSGFWMFCGVIFFFLLAEGILAASMEATAPGLAVLRAKERPSCRIAGRDQLGAGPAFFSLANAKANYAETAS